MGEVKLTAQKMSRGAFASTDSGRGVPCEGRDDVAIGVATVGVAIVGVAIVGVAIVAIVGILAIGVCRGVGVAIGVGVVRSTDGTSSYQGGEGKSRDDFELHIVLFVVILNSEY